MSKNSRIRYFQEINTKPRNSVGAGSELGGRELEGFTVYLLKSQLCAVNVNLYHGSTQIKLFIS